LHVAVTAFGVHAPALRGPSRTGRAAGGRRADRCLDQLAQAFAGVEAIAVSASEAIRVDHDLTRPRQTRGEALDRPGPGGRQEPAGLAQVPAQGDAGARRIDVLPARTTRTARLLHQLGERNAVAPREL